MSDKSFFVTYTGSDIVELGKAGVFGPGISAFVTAEIAEMAKAAKDFNVVEQARPEPSHSTREALDAAQQAEAAKESGGGGSASAAPAPAKPAAPAPAPSAAPAKPAADEKAGAKGDDKDDKDDKGGDKGAKSDEKKSPSAGGGDKK